MNNRGWQWLAESSLQLLREPIMKIKEIHVYQIDLPTRNGPYTSADGDLYSLDSTVVELICDNGIKGYGETCPAGPTYAPEHALGARAALAQMAPHLMGENPLLRNNIHTKMESHLNGHAYAKAAIDIAIWDIAGKFYDMRICDLLGGAKFQKVPTYFTTGSVSPDEAVRIAKEKRDQGHDRLQIKVGGRPLDVDIEVIRKVWEATGTSMRYCADANRSWSTRDTLIASSALAGIPIVFEQPCKTMAEIAAIRSQIAHPIYIDEISFDIATVIDFIGKGLCDGFGFKLSRLGGITGLSQARDICKAVNLPHTCDDALCGDIMAAACLHVGATVDAKLNEGVWVASPYVDGHYDPNHCIEIESGKIQLPPGPGLGVVPQADKLGLAQASYG